MKEILYIMNSGVELIKSKDTLKCLIPDKHNPGKYKIKTIPISRLNSIEIYGNIKISSPLLKLCNKVGIPCFFNTYYGKPIGKFTPENAQSSIVKLRQYETFLDKNKKLNIAKSIIYKASKERLRILHKYSNNNNFDKKISKLVSFLKRIKSSKTIHELRGIEGNIVKSYFNIFSLLLNNLIFNRRTQRPPKDEGNAIMSFGNVLLYNTVRAEIYKCALDPLVGFLHEPYQNRDSLALDISEIFRPIIVDNLILMLDHKSNLLPSHFKKDEVKCFLNQRGKAIWMKEFKKFLRVSVPYEPLRRKIAIKEEIKLECYNLIKFFTDENPKYLPIDFQNA